MVMTYWKSSEEAERLFLFLFLFTLKSLLYSATVKNCETDASLGSYNRLTYRLSRLISVSLQLVGMLSTSVLYTLVDLIVAAWQTCFANLWVDFCFCYRYYTLLYIEDLRGKSAQVRFALLGNIETYGLSVFETYEKLFEFLFWITRFHLALFVSSIAAIF